MEKLKKIWKSTLLIIYEKKIIQYILIVAILFLPVASIVSNKLFNKINTNKINTVEESSTSSNKDITTKGSIKTDVAKNSDDEETEMSSYTLGSGYSKVDSNKSSVSKNNNTSSSQSSTTVSKIDKSSLKGNNISILEGDDFDPIKDLKLTATDKDGTDISDKIVVENNYVNSNKAGTYTVKANVRLKDGYTIQKTFNVTVKATKLELTLNSFKPIKNIVEKNESVVLDLELSISKKNVTPTYIMINGQEYTLYKGNSNILSTVLNKQNYKVNLKSGNEAGIEEYKISYIRMSDGTLINIDKTTNVEILKSKAKIKNFYYEENSLEKIINTKFDLEDIDNSASNLNLEVYKGGELVYSEKLDRKSKYDLNIPTKSKGLYEVKVLADVNLSSSTNKVIENTEIFSENINITKIDESSIIGNNTEIMVGDEFNPIRDLNLQATDVDGEDITENIVIDSPNIDTNIEGEYKVLVHVINKEEKTIKAEFTVVVKEYQSRISRIARLFGIETYKTTFSRSSNNNSTVIGNDTETLTSNVGVSGFVSKKDGEAPDGKLYVELPTRLAFSVDQKGNLTGGVYTISNNSSCDVDVFVGEFRETNKDGGITVKPLSENIEDVDRSNIHLYLQGDDIVDLGETITTDKHLVKIEKSNTRNIQLLGNSGKGINEKVDKDGVDETFNMVFKIKKKS